MGADPDCRSFDNGNTFASFSLATSEVWRDSNTGEERDKTEWHRCVCYRGLAGVVQQYVRKGSKIFVEGKLQTRKWTDQNGIDRYSTEIVIDNMQLLDSRNSGNFSPFDNQQNYSNRDFRQGTPFQQQDNYAARRQQQYGQQFGQQQQAPFAAAAAYNGADFGQGQNYQPAMPQQAPSQSSNNDPDSNMNGGGGFQDDDIPF